jgi:hypothetical protein
MVKILFPAPQSETEAKALARTDRRATSFMKFYRV